MGVPMEDLRNESKERKGEQILYIGFGSHGAHNFSDSCWVNYRRDKEKMQIQT